MRLLPLSGLFGVDTVGRRSGLVRFDGLSVGVVHVGERHGRLWRLGDDVALRLLGQHAVENTAYFWIYFK